MQERVPSLQELEDLIDRALYISGQPYTRQEVLRDMERMNHKFESPEEAEWAVKEMTKKQYQAGMNASIPDPETPRGPNRKARRAFQSNMKKRVKKIIKEQDNRNAKHAARIKANSSSDDRTAGIGEVDPRQDYY